MEIFSGPKKDSLVVKSRVKGQYGQKYILVVNRKAPRWKALDSLGIHVRQDNLILPSPLGSDGNLNGELSPQTRTAS